MKIRDHVEDDEEPGDADESDDDREEKSFHDGDRNSKIAIHAKKCHNDHTVLRMSGCMNSIALTMPATTTSSPPADEAHAADEPVSDRARFSALMREHHRELLVYARALTRDHHGAQDVVQDALVSAFGRFQDFDEERDFGAWMRGFVRFKAKDWFRKQGKTPQLPDGDPDDLEAAFENWQNAKHAGTGAVFEALEGCLKLLPERLGKAVKAVYFKDVAGPEAADSLGISAASLRKRLERARGQLHACITRKLQTQS